MLFFGVLMVSVPSLGFTHWNGTARAVLERFWSISSRAGAHARSNAIDRVRRAHYRSDGFPCPEVAAMVEWALQNPYLTTFLVLVAVEALGPALVAIARRL
jgi:hypothetical protein